MKTSREVMNALLAGKKLRRTDLQNGAYVHLVDDNVVWESGFAATLVEAEAYEVYEPKNPHIKGTFAWAREESARGKRVRLGGGRILYTHDYMSNNRPLFLKQCFTLTEIDATDWEITT